MPMHVNTNKGMEELVDGVGHTQRVLPSTQYVHRHGIGWKQI